jgi:hypothetical protein
MKQVSEQYQPEKLPLKAFRHQCGPLTTTQLEAIILKAKQNSSSLYQAHQQKENTGKGHLFCQYTADITQQTRPTVT